MQTLLYRLNKNLGMIIVLHRVVPSMCDLSSDPLLRHRSIAITVESLDRAIQYFNSKGYTFVSLSQLEKCLTNHVKNKKFISFTFDDGYRDNFLYAYPLMKKYKVPFTIYLTTGLPDHSQCLWWFYLEDWIETGTPINFDFMDNRFSFRCQNNQDKRDAFAKLAIYLENTSTETQARFISEILGPRFGDPIEKTRIYSMNWEQIRFLSRDPLATIASHGIFHSNLTSLTTLELEKNLIHSKIRIEQEIDQPVVHFAYPFGHIRAFNENVMRTVKRSGYLTAVTTLHGTLKPKDSNNLFRLPRICLNNKSDPWLELLSTGLPRRLYM